MGNQAGSHRPGVSLLSRYPPGLAAGSWPHGLHRSLPAISDKSEDDSLPSEIPGGPVRDCHTDSRMWVSPPTCAGSMPKCCSLKPFQGNLSDRFTGFQFLMRCLQVLGIDPAEVFTNSGLDIALVNKIRYMV